MTRIEAQILKSQRRVAALKEKQRKEKLKQLETEREKKKKNPVRRGRPRLKPELIAKARKLAEKLPLPDVALRLGISRSSLLNYGITRNALNTEAAFNVLMKRK